MKRYSAKLLLLAVLSLWLDGIAIASEGLWIDVRSAVEYKTGHLNEAVNIPHLEIADRIAEIAANRDTPIKLYCVSGRRAGIAKRVLESMGYSRVTNEGGYRDLLDSSNDEVAGQADTD